MVPFKPSANPVIVSETHTPYFSFPSLFPTPDHSRLQLEMAFHFLFLLTLLCSMSVLFVHRQQCSRDLWAILGQLWFSGIQGKILYFWGKMWLERKKIFTRVHRKKVLKIPSHYLCFLVQFHILPLFPLKTRNFHHPPHPLPLKWSQIVQQF